jgi:hypothetical protein
VPKELQQEWHLLYNSSRHGVSFSTFMARVGGDETAPTLLLIRDKAGAVFGGVAQSPWRKTGKGLAGVGEGLGLPAVPGFDSCMCLAMARNARGLCQRAAPPAPCSELN